MTGEKLNGKIFVPGGIVSPGDLRRIAATCVHFGIPHLHFGKRQEILLQFKEDLKKDLAVRFSNIQYKFQSGGEVRNSNIVSSCVVKNLDNARKWLTEGVYREILGSFTYEPKIKINICDPLQGMIPLFGGQLNFIASQYDNYWHLYILASNKKSVWEWPVLIDSKEIAHLSYEMEKILSGSPAISKETLEERIYEIKEWTFRAVSEKPDFTPKRFFNYEGFHPMGENRYWLGIYERLNEYPVEFIEALTMLCNQTDIGSIHITPFKSIIIKNIAEKDIALWENLLGKYKVNTGHSSLEVNFMLPDFDPEALKLRKQIFGHFDSTEVRSEGLVFSLHSDPTSISGATIMVEKVVKGKLGSFALFTSYRIKYKKDFNPNSFETVTFTEFVKRRDVPEVLRYLCGIYYEHLQARQEQKTSEEEVKEELKPSYVCSSCLTEYDEKYGDSYNFIIPGIPFYMLPESYKCPVCDADKSTFRKVSEDTVEV